MLTLEESYSITNQLISYQFSFFLGALGLLLSIWIIKRWIYD